MRAKGEIYDKIFELESNGECELAEILKWVLNGDDVCLSCGIFDVENIEFGIIPEVKGGENFE